jgi:hypothetical protein
MRNAFGAIAVFSGVAWRTISQKVERKTDYLVQAAGYTATENYTGFGAGPTAGIFWRTPLGCSGFIGMEGNITLLVVK